MGERARRRFQDIGREFPAKVAELLVSKVGAERVKPATGSMFNRPARRYLVRLYCLLRYGWANAHAEEWWPDLSMTLPSAGPGWRNPFPGRTDRAACCHMRCRRLRRRRSSSSGQARPWPRRKQQRIPIESALLLNGAVNLIDPQGFASAGRRCRGRTVRLAALADLAGEGAARHAVLFLDVGNPGAVRDGAAMAGLAIRAPPRLRAPALWHEKAGQPLHCASLPSCAGLATARPRYRCRRARALCRPARSQPAPRSSRSRSRRRVSAWRA